MSQVTYTSVYTDSEPWRYYKELLAEIGFPRVIVYGYDGLHMQPVAPPSPDYVPGPEHPPSLDYMPDPKEDLEDDHADYPADGGDGDDEPFDDDDDDDDDTNDEDEEPFKDEEEGEHLTLTDSSIVPIMDHVPPTGDTEASETDESAPRPGSPQTIIPFSQTHLRRARKTVRLKPPILTDTGASLGFRAAAIRMRALLPSTFGRTNIPEADVPPRKRAFLTTPAPGFEITDTWDEIVDTLMEIALTTLEGVDQRVIEFDTTVRQRTSEFEEELNLVQLGSHIRIEEGLRNKELDNNPKGKNQIGSSSVNMVERDGAKNSSNNKNKRKFKSGDDKFANKKGTITCWKCKKTGHMKKDCHSRKGNDGAGLNGSKYPEKQQGYM
uniref:CCHC-type domain-containing protein n=1 Tax=Tanacetum cinerariifolium TaxID=118510 RepID=A0A6L2NJ67_TANCI|nr:hypothetical protein [Tanacetum cinerariifolium]